MPYGYDGGIDLYVNGYQVKIPKLSQAQIKLILNVHQNDVFVNALNGAEKRTLYSLRMKFKILNINEDEKNIINPVILDVIPNFIDSIS